MTPEAAFRAALLGALCLLAAACQTDALSGLREANPLLARLTGPDAEELRSLPPETRYRKTYHAFLSETQNLARSAEERSRLRARNAGRRIVGHLVLLLGAVDDPVMEGHLVDALRSFIRMAEALLEGSRDRGSGAKVRTLRDRYAELLHPARVRGFAPAAAQPKARGPARGRVVGRRTESALEKGRPVTRFFLTVETGEGERVDVEVAEQAYRGAKLGERFEGRERGETPDRAGGADEEGGSRPSPGREGKPEGGEPGGKG